MEQLHAQSIQARKNRERLLNRTANVHVKYEHSSGVGAVSHFSVFYHLNLKKISVLRQGCIFAKQAILRYRDIDAHIFCVVYVSVSVHPWLNCRALTLL